MPDRRLARLLEVAAALDQLGAEGGHRAVLLDRVALRYVDRDRQPVAAAGKRDALAVIAARRRDQPARLGMFALEPVDIDQAAAHLESARGCVVLVLDQDVGAETLREQRP